MEQYHRHSGVLPDERLQMTWRRLGQSDIIVTQTRMELNGLPLPTRHLANATRSVMHKPITQPPVRYPDDPLLLRVPKDVVVDNFLESLFGEVLVGLDRDVQTGTVANDALEAHHLRVGDGLTDGGVKVVPDLVKEYFHVVCIRVYSLLLVLDAEVSGMFMHDSPGDRLNPHDALTRTPRKGIMPAVPLDIIKVVQPIIHQDGLNPIQALTNPILIVLNPPQLNGTHDSLPSRGTITQHMRELLHAADVCQAGVRSVDGIARGLGEDGNERVLGQGIRFEEIVGVVVNDGAFADGAYNLGELRLGDEASACSGGGGAGQGGHCHQWCAATDDVNVLYVRIWS